MKKLLRKVDSSRIIAAEDDSKLLDTLDSLKDDFDFIMTGLEKLDRSGAEASNNGLIIAEKLQSYMQEIIASIGEQVQ